VSSVLQGGSSVGTGRKFGITADIAS